jgi:20S proteasome alpha/beta subunit
VVGTNLKRICPLKTKSYGVDWRGLPVKRPYSWEKEMTVCMAAACKTGDNRKIMLCADHKSSSILGSSETARKEVPIGSGWYCLTAGTESAILGLVRLLKVEFNDDNNIKPETIDATIKRVLYQRRNELVEEYSQLRFSFSYNGFIKYGKERLPTEIFYDATQKIVQIELNADLIIAGLIGDDPEIYYTDSKGIVRAASHFAVIGEGEYIAASSLLRRGQNDWTSLEKTLYNVFEAKRLSESVGSVGKRTHIAVLEPEERRLTSLGLDKQLESWFEKYGPQEVPDDRKFEGEYYF